MKITLTILRVLNIVIPLICFIILYNAIFNVSVSAKGWAEYFALEGLVLLIIGFIGIRYVLNDIIENKKWVIWITWSFLICGNLILTIQFTASLIQTLIASALVYAFTLEKEKVNLKIRIISNFVLLALNIGWGIFVFGMI
mgnify:CR=1 FL=1